jgi:hypothetical protein
MGGEIKHLFRIFCKKVLALKSTIRISIKTVERIPKIMR